jgi:hypothetical protein
MGCRGMVPVSMRLYVLITAVAGRPMIGHGGTDEKISPVWIGVTIRRPRMRRRAALSAQHEGIRIQERLAPELTEPTMTR